MTLSRLVFRMIAITFIIWLVFAVHMARGSVPVTTTSDAIPLPPPSPGPPPVVTTALPRPVADLELAALRHRLKTEHQRLLAARARVRGLTRTLAHTTTTREAINLACSVYGNCSLMWRRANCESHLYPYAKNPSGASGLYQFLPSTWSTTPFASFSMWSPYAQALAAGWMQTHGRGGEWVCG